MASHRLTFLYPHLFKPNRLSDVRFRVKPPRPRRNHQTNTASFSIWRRHRQEEIQQRYGPAQEPQLPPPSKPDHVQVGSEDKSLANAIETEVKATPPPAAEKRTKSAPTSKDPKATASAGLKKTTAQMGEPGIESRESKDQQTDSEVTDPTQDKATQPLQAEPSRAVEVAPQQQAYLRPKTELIARRPLEIFQLNAPAGAQRPEEHHAFPHMKAPPYVHHFDTYTLVKNLQKGGFTQAQSTTLMKAVRGLLAHNMEIAKEGLVSKSDVENETYLFRAACSELRTEILSLRSASARKRQTQLHHLQHTFDILSQRVSQETLTLKDDLKALFNDRRMATREESQRRDSEISELSYRISARLGGETKSGVEGLRWILTRRAALAIVGMALLIITTLRLGSLKKEREAKEEAERLRKKPTSDRGVGPDDDGSGAASGGGLGSVATSPSAALAEKGEEVGYVSLG